MSDWELPNKDTGLLQDVSSLAFFVCIRGPVRSKSNYRNAAGVKARSSWKAVHAYEDGLAITVRAARPEGWVLSAEGLAVPERPVVVAALAARTTLDTGNLSKSVLDACQGVLVRNDAEFKGLSEVVERTRKGPGIVAAFDQMPAGTSAQDASLRAYELMTAILNYQPQLDS